jgi:putative toxin-antitoxin system antitoxin component (TIGR02293 family)
MGHAARLVRVEALATELIGDESKATAWLRAPSASLGGETPMAMLDTAAGADRVVESLYAVAHGGVA